ncbi:hypothetical protein DSL92_01890 [Billgrantia gudaonensis]|uniref:Uncharacterized protein n=1 Tax=Billgrantia gudaonensis TaxID=376427 RepID=A0A432JLP3_9GAMM|nr:hypothetical protein DSL92_01890 [Halomonas gudaonensis]
MLEGSSSCPLPSHFPVPPSHKSRIAVDEEASRELTGLRNGVSGSRRLSRCWTGSTALPCASPATTR